MKVGKMKEFEYSKIINTTNKRIEGNIPKELEEKINKRQYKILVGDLCEDTKVIPEKMIENTLTIGILNKNIEKNLKEYNKQFDVVLTGEDANFLMLNKLI